MAKIALDDYPNISTHTLTWSVTIFDNTAVTAEIISTHTLTWSVTQTIQLHD